MNPNVPDRQQEKQGKVNFRCSDVGPKHCEWQISGNSEEEIMPKIEQHGREKHDLAMGNETRSKVRNAIHQQAATASNVR
jgi:predicted small metal-binding protein